MASLLPAAEQHGDGGLFLAEASKLAERTVKQWIRAVLREVALQALRDNLELVRGGIGTPEHLDGVGNGDHPSSTTRRAILQLTNGALERAQELCRLVASRWSHKLKLHGLIQVCEWIQAVVDHEVDVLFYIPPNAQQIDNQRQRHPRRRPFPSTAPFPVARLQQRAAQGSIVESCPSQYVTALARLQFLGRNPREELAPEVAMRQIDDWAMHGQVDWPYNWNILQRASDALEFRLHNFKRRNRTDTELVLVPKSVAAALLPSSEEGDANDPNGPNDRPFTDAESFILRRKRKSRHKIQQSAAHTDVMGKDNDDEEEVEPQAVPSKDWPPRNASDLGECQWSAQDLLLSPEDRVYLEKTYLHPEAPDSDSAKATSTLLGSLSEVGRFHHWQQQAVDQGPPTALAGNGPEHWRQQRRSTNERMADHKVAQDVRGAEQASKVIRAVDARGRHWMELDLGHCLWELPTDDDSDEAADTNPHLPKQRKLYYFDSLEISLLDEDPKESAP